MRRRRMNSAERHVVDIFLERDGSPINAQGTMGNAGIPSALRSESQGFSWPRLDADTCSTPMMVPVRRQADPSPPTLKPQKFILIEGLLVL